ncbi:class I SAM-dependent methyltransferase, partial [Candidatus Pelagibacter ubique]|nr:class I SAM-dependent methyltransferase [Candidatus Pelagibacter ubique]
EKNFDTNTSAFQLNKRLKKFKMNSNEFFMTNSKKYDLIFVDGDHSSIQVKIDINNSWKILNKGGYLILDDYMWWFYKNLKKNPSSSINNFIANNISEISSLKIWQQVIIKKNI